MEKPTDFCEHVITDVDQRLVFQERLMDHVEVFEREASSSYSSQKRGPTEPHPFYFRECKTLDNNRSPNDKTCKAI